jgi:AcrR family transcriptional regulator
MTRTSAESTELQILAAAREQVLKNGGRASMGQIAKAAGVSRRTVYVRFGSRAGLFFKLLRHRSTQEFLGVAGVMDAMSAALDAPEAEALTSFEVYFRSLIEYAAAVDRFSRPLWVNADEDPELSAAFREIDAIFAAQFEEIFRRLETQGLLRASWTVAEAAKSAYQMSMYPAFIGHLRLVRGWSVSEIEERGLRNLKAAFLVEKS